MSKNIWPGFLSWPSRKTFSAWQIELTTRCPLRCRMCIKEEYKGGLQRDMNMDYFRRLLPYLKDVETVILEGWGESLLHKNLLECIRLVKREGAQVGFVTSGMGLNEAYISELILAGVDFIGFSLAGATPKTHNSIRVNSELPALLNHMQNFQEIKSRQKLKKPRLHIVYLLLKENILEVPLLVKLARDMKLEEIVLINLIHVTNAWQDEQKIFARNWTAAYEEILQEAEKKAHEWKIKLRHPSLLPKDVPVCEENPLRNLYVSTDGKVSPCVYLNPPLPSPFKRIFQGEEYQIEKVSFENIFREPLSAIWNHKGYVEFRNCFSLREKKFAEMYFPLWNPEKGQRLAMKPFPDPPEPCKTCHKMLGI